jgi:hypothetical protein
MDGDGDGQHGQVQVVKFPEVLLCQAWLPSPSLVSLSLCLNSSLLTWKETSAAACSSQVLENTYIMKPQEHEK